MQTCANTSLSQDFVGQTGPKPNDPPWYPVKTLAFAFALQRSASLSQTLRSSQRVSSKPVWFYSRLSRCIVFDRILLATKLLYTYIGHIYNIHSQKRSKNDMTCGKTLACFNSRSSFTFRACNAIGLGSTSHKKPVNKNDMMTCAQSDQCQPRVHNSAGRKGSSHDLQSSNPSNLNGLLISGGLYSSRNDSAICHSKVTDLDDPDVYVIWCKTMWQVQLAPN